MDQINTDAWIGRAISEHGGVDQKTAAQLHATVGRADTTEPSRGDLLPGLWHWCAFPPTAHVSDLGRDGHPGGGVLLPPLGLPRRMWAGGSLRFHAPIRIGDPLERVSTVRAITPKSTAAGPMALVTLDHVISGPRGLAIQEQQDIVYLPLPESYTPPKARPMPARTSTRTAMTAPLLFRYSALTFNAHRIHYDLAYTRTVEHYPDLVVHGPLQATLLMRTATQMRGEQPQFFDFRAVHPLFAGTDLEIATAEEAEDDGAMQLWTGQNGHQGMQATAIWEATQ